MIVVALPLAQRRASACPLAAPLAGVEVSLGAATCFVLVAHPPS